MAKQRGLFHPVPAEFSYNDPSVSLTPSSLSSMGTPQVSSTEESSIIDTAGSAVVSAARSSNGKQSTSANRTTSGIQGGKQVKQTTTKASSKQAKKLPKAKETAIQDEEETEEQDRIESVQEEALEETNLPRNIQQFQFAATTEEPFMFNTPAPFTSTTPNIDFRPDAVMIKKAKEAPITAETEAVDARQQRDRAAKAKTAKAREALAKKRKEKSQNSEPANKRSAKRSTRFIDQLEQTNLESELSSAGDIDLAEMERQLNEDRIRSDTDFQPSSLPDMRTKNRKRKQPCSESELSFNPRSSQRINKAPETTTERQ